MSLDSKHQPTGPQAWLPKNIWVAGWSPRGCVIEGPAEEIRQLALRAGLGRIRDRGRLYLTNAKIKKLKEAAAAAVDASVENHGTVFLVLPLTETAKRWCEDNLPDDAPMLGSGFAVEHRFILSIVDGMRGDGLVVK